MTDSLIGCTLPIQITSITKRTMFFETQMGRHIQGEEFARTFWQKDEKLIQRKLLTEVAISPNVTILFPENFQKTKVLPINFQNLLNNFN